jgi:hypothetical protein
MFFDKLNHLFAALRLKLFRIRRFDLNMSTVWSVPFVKYYDDCLFLLSSLRSYTFLFVVAGMDDKTVSVISDMYVISMVIFAFISMHKAVHIGS